MRQSGVSIVISVGPTRAFWQEMTKYGAHDISKPDAHPLITKEVGIPTYWRDYGELFLEIKKERTRTWGDDGEAFIIIISRAPVAFVARNCGKKDTLKESF